ncbi:hypothetical protein PV396_03120 [Streptomyces sp. ME02-8801-2C]|nr:hypothetical protein [Streptomyces sp. ME02-8801-2C]MDX3450944.1 hypothetical protein [Streptomyces sp. ME02-8801-2C]
MDRRSEGEFVGAAAAVTREPVVDGLANLPALLRTLPLPPPSPPAPS